MIEVVIEVVVVVVIEVVVVVVEVSVLFVVEMTGTVEKVNATKVMGTLDG